MRRATTVAILLAMTLSAAAESPKISGSYGNANGCRQVAKGDYDGDDLLVLTPKDVSTYATGCSFIQLLPAGDLDLVATVICGHEGEDLTTLGMMRLRKEEGRDAFTIFTEDGSSWGTAERCP